MRPLRADSADRAAANKRPARKKSAAPGVQRAMPKRNRRRKLTLAALAVGLVAVVAVLASGPMQSWRDQTVAGADRALDDFYTATGLTIREVTITGRVRANPETLRDLLDVAVGDSILRIDLEAAKQRLESLGWVRTALISRILPDRLHIAIEEREPFARWQRDGRVTLVDAEGAVILANVGNRFRTLPRLVGPQANIRAAALFGVLAQAPVLADLVTTASLIRERRWDIGMANGVTIRLPEEAIGEAWTRFNEVERRDGLLAQELNLIDLRVPGRVIVRLKPKSSGADKDRET